MPAVLVPAGIVGWLAVGRPPIPTETWLLALVSGLLEAVYFALLSGAYARGDLSLVYPIARGTAPVLSVFVGIVFLGERLGPVGALGVAPPARRDPVAPAAVGRARAIGRPAAAGPRGGLAGGRDRGLDRLLLGRRPDRRPVGPALAVRDADLVVHRGLPDRRHRDRRPPAAGRRVERAFESAAAVTGIEAADAAASLPPDGAPSAAGSGTLGWGRAAIGGLVTVVAYMLVLVAYVYAPLSVVAPVRESAIVLVSGWGSFRLGEAATRRVGLSRLAAAAVIVVGAFLLAVEG